MKSNLNKKIGATLLTAAVMTGTLVIPTVKAADVATAPSVSYQAHVQDIGWQNPVSTGMAGTTGRSLRMEAIRMHLENCEDVSLSFDAHIQDIGWRNNLKESDIIGTEGQSKRLEAIRIRANGLAEKGYKLQYRVHVQDYGTDGWQEWKNEGETAGTEAQSRRIEAIEIRVVKTNTDLTTVKEEAIAKVSEVLNKLEQYSTENQETIKAMVEEAVKAINEATSEEAVNEIVANTETKISEVKTVAQEAEEVKAEIIATLEKYDDALRGDKGANDTDYKKISEKIATAIEEIKVAEDKAVIDEIFNKQVKDIQKIVSPKTIEDVVAEQEKALATAIEQLNKEIAEYEEFMPKATDLTENDKARLNAIIANTKERMDEAKIATDIATIATNFTSMVEAAPFGLATKLENYKDLVAAQKSADTEIAIYESALEQSSYSDAYKKLANSSIVATKNEVANAKLPSDVTTSMEKLKEILESDQFKEIAEIAKEEIEKNQVKEAKEAAIKALTDYEYVYEEVETKAQEYIAEIEKLEDVATINSKKADYISALDTLKGQIKDDIDAYELAKKAAMTDLNACLDAIEELGLNENDKESITEMVELTKSKIDSVSTAANVTDAMTVFNNYMSKGYANIEKDIAEYQFNAVKENALSTLADYEKSEIKVVKDEATSTKETIEKIKVESTDTKATIDAKKVRISNALTPAVDNIELNIAKNEAKTVADALIKELRTYVGTTNLDDVIAKASKAMDKINDLYEAANEVTVGSTAVSTIEDKIDEMKTVKRNALNEITTIINENAEKVKEDLKNAKKKASDEIAKYIELAKSLEDDNLLNTLNDYAEFVNDADRLAELESVVSFVVADGSLSEDCLLSKLINSTDLETRVEAIKTIEQKYKDAYTSIVDGKEVVDADIKNDKTLAAQIQEFIDEVKNPETESDRITEIITDSTGDVDVAITATTTKYADLKTAKSTAIAKIEVGTSQATNAYATYTLKTEIIAKYVKQIEGVALTSKPEEGITAEQAKIDAIVANALKEIQNQLTIILTSEAKAKYADLKEAADEADDGEYDAIIAETVTENFADDSVDKTTTDNMLAAATTTKAAIDAYTLPAGTTTPTISKIEVTTNPTTTSYTKDDASVSAWNLTGGVITVTYDNATTKTVNMTDSTVSATTAFDNSQAGTVTVTVSYTPADGTGTYTATFDVTVTE